MAIEGNESLKRGTTVSRLGSTNNEELRLPSEQQKKKERKKGQEIVSTICHQNETSRR
jgi:hypothetical protein